MYRYLLAAVFALGVSLGLFYFMSYLVSGEVHVSKSSENINYMNFIRVKNEQNPEAKKRVMPKEPKPEEKPPKPKIEAKTDKIVNKEIHVDVPKFNLPLDFAKDALKGLEVTQSFADINSVIAVNLLPIFKVPPRYPNRAKMLKKEGYVELEFTITKDGLVEDIIVIDADPKSIFDNSAKRALEKWKFKPKISNGKAVEQRARQTIEYKLR